MQDAGPEIKARYPLYEARVDVVEQAGKPGEYQAIAYLRPHFQLEGLTASLRLVAKLPKGAS
jgi:type VI secretion system protein ImpC